MSSETLHNDSHNESDDNSKYYVPESSRLPIFASIGLITTVFGAAHWMNGTKFLGFLGVDIFTAGLAIFTIVLASWWNVVIKENMAGLPNDKLKRSYVWGMRWFIFSEVMFFFIFFFVWAYVRIFGLGFIEDGGEFPGFTAEWPLMVTPDQAVLGADAAIKGPEGLIDPWHLPLWNTIILISSSFTVHWAHHALKKNNRNMFNAWLGLTVVLGAVFLYFQVAEYKEAYEDLGLTLESGIYGTGFFMLTGFHGLHVTMGTVMLAIQLIRSFRGHFTKDDHFGFEASSWYWHFVDVVWIMLFVVVYVF